jgi:hypothetical protein
LHGESGANSALNSSIRSKKILGDHFMRILGVAALCAALGGCAGPDRSGELLDTWHACIVAAVNRMDDGRTDPISVAYGIQPQCGDITSRSFASAGRPHITRVFSEKPLRRRDLLDWAGVAFFARDKLLENGQPVSYPTSCDGVFAVIDTASKTGTEHDATAVTFFALDKLSRQSPLLILDWDITQIEGALLETWLPMVFGRLEELSRQCGARHGSLGAMIEDKNSGTILLQQAQRRGMRAEAIESKLTAMGKDERALSVSGYVYRGNVKYTEYAFNKTTVYKRKSRNHLGDQIESFRIGEGQPTRGRSFGHILLRNRSCAWRRKWLLTNDRFSEASAVKLVERLCRRASVSLALGLLALSSHGLRWFVDNHPVPIELEKYNLFRFRISPLPETLARKAKRRMIVDS